MRLPLALALALLAAAVTAAPLLGQPDRGAPIVLRLPAGTRALALGEAYAAVSDNDAVFYNPAGLVGARGLGVSVQRYGGPGTLGVVSAAVPVAPLAVGVGVQMVSFAPPCGECEAAVAPTPGALPLGGARLASSAAATLGVAATVKGIRVGLAGKYIEARLPNTLASGGAVDVGASAGGSFVRAGLAVQNLGERLRDVGGRDYDLPWRATLAAALGPGPLPADWIGPYFDLALTGALSYAQGKEFTPAAGVELTFAPLEGFSFAGRLGARATHGDGTNPVTAGLAFVGERFTLEYAFQGLVGPSDGHRVGVRWR